MAALCPTTRATADARAGPISETWSEPPARPVRVPGSSRAEKLSATTLVVSRGRAGLVAGGEALRDGFGGQRGDGGPDPAEPLFALFGRHVVEHRRAERVEEYIAGSVEREAQLVRPQPPSAERRGQLA